MERVSVLVLALSLFAAAVVGVAGMGIDRAEAAREAAAADEWLADATDASRMPPPPPFDSVMLQIEAQIAEHEAADEQSQAKSQAAAAAATAAAAKAAATAKVNVAAAAKAKVEAASGAKSRLRGQTHARSGSGARAHSRGGDPFPDQDFTYKDVNSPPEWLVPEESEPAGPTTKPPPVPQMIPPPPPVPFPTYNYHDPNSAGPFSQYAPGVQGSGYDGGYNGPYDGFSMYGHPPNAGQTRGWMNPSIPRTAAQIAAATAASQYHPYGAPPPLYAMGQPPPDGAASWVPLGAFLQPNTLEGGAGEE